LAASSRYPLNAAWVLLNKKSGQNQFFDYGH
jgi:hypothetical protein